MSASLDTGAAGVCPPPAWDFVAETIGTLNRALRRRGSALRIPFPRGERGDRDRISTFLMAVLRETRDRRAFELLYRLNARTIFFFCRARLRNRWLACEPADIVDGTFLKIYLGCHTFRLSHRSTFTGWAIVVAENLIRETAKRPGTSMLRGSQSLRGLHGLRGLEDARPAPLAGLLVREEEIAFATGWDMFLRLCAAVILTLPPRWREVLELREGQRLTYAEIAARLRLSNGCVGMLIRRARLRVLKKVKATLDRWD